MKLMIIIITFGKHIFGSKISKGRQQQIMLLNISQKIFSTYFHINNLKSSLRLFREKRFQIKNSRIRIKKSNRKVNDDEDDDNDDNNKNKCTKVIMT